MDKKSFLCQNCGECCKCMVLPVQKPLQKSLMEEWLDVRGCEVVNETSDTMYVKVNSPCPHLSKSESRFLCSIYNDRPEGCRLFDGSTYDWLDCKWKKSENYVVLEKSRVFARKPKMGTDQVKRLARRKSAQKREERASDIKAYGRSLED